MQAADQCLAWAAQMWCTKLRCRFMPLGQWNVAAGQSAGLYWRRPLRVEPRCQAGLHVTTIMTQRFASSQLFSSLYADLPGLLVLQLFYQPWKTMVWPKGFMMSKIQISTIQLSLPLSRVPLFSPIKPSKSSLITTLFNQTATCITFTTAQASRKCMSLSYILLLFSPKSWSPVWKHTGVGSVFLKF